MDEAHADLPSRYRRSDGTIDTARLKAEISIAAIAATASTLKRSGRQLKGICPLHDENEPSFFVDDGKGVFFCFGCGAGGDAIALQSRLHGQTFREACLELAGAHRGATPRPTATARRPGLRTRPSGFQLARAEWRGAGGVEGTPAEAYLISRAIGHDVPPSIRFGRIPRFWRDDGRPGPRLPARVAAAQDVRGAVVGILRTFVEDDGRKARHGETRLSLGRIRGSALRLGPVAPAIMLASAVEDALSLRLMFPGATVWSTFGDANLPLVELPPAVRKVTLCGDADATGRAAVAAAAAALMARGIEVDGLFPRAGAKDFNEEWVLLHT
ncbi:CHC2 zinc finger domain-containing protein [Sphingomonas adhaesiva]|nr:CHC2 zinc finger domain-containing protein [Sphingomonas adhaesiva]